MICKYNDVEEQVMTDINVKTLTYIKNCEKQTIPRNIQLTRRYLNEYNLLAVPFDKGIGIFVIQKETYNSRLNDIINLPQFLNEEQKRKNEKNPVLKEEERIVRILKKLKDESKINASLFEMLKSTGSQPPQLYGLAKVHKVATPLRPILSMPGSSYFKIARQVADRLSVIEECKINSSTQSIWDNLKTITLEEDQQLVSFDICSLYTNVPVHEAITYCADLLHNKNYKRPPVSKETFIELATLCNSNVLMLTHDGYYH